MEPNRGLRVFICYDSKWRGHFWFLFIIYMFVDKQKYEYCKIWILNSHVGAMDHASLSNGDYLSSMKPLSETNFASNKI